MPIISLLLDLNIGITLAVLKAWGKIPRSNDQSKYIDNIGASTTAPIRKKKGLMLSAPLALFGLIELISVERSRFAVRSTVSF